MENIGVYQAISAVQGELAKVGIGKDQKNTGQGYKFRGIDDIYNSIASLLAVHKLCILPRVTGRTVDRVASKSGAMLNYVAVNVEFDFVSAEDGSKHTVATFGEAMDSGDKATNKAMSAAYKYACLQAFCIPTEGDNDADSSSPEIGDPDAREATLEEKVKFLGIMEDERERVGDHAFRELLMCSGYVAIEDIIARDKQKIFYKRIIEIKTEEGE